MFNQEFKIENLTVGKKHPVFFIAEAGVNHNGDIDLAKKLIDAAKEAGASAVKFQTFKAEHLNTVKAPKSTYHIETTGEGSWFDLLKSQELSRGDHEILIDYCHRQKIIFLSTPYDFESVDLLCGLNVSALKIASTDANNLPFLKYVARQKKPVLLSTGMCSLEEVRESVDVIRSAGCHDLVLFHCTANYPAKFQDANLLAMQQLEKEFGVLVGYSDHTTNNLVAGIAVGLGAVMYEKHFTLDKSLPGPDHRASSEPQELKTLIKIINNAKMILGSPDKQCLPSENENRQKLRKSIVALKDIQKGTTLSEEFIGIKRPGLGLAPKHFDNLIGKKIKKNIFKDDFIVLNDVE